MTTKLTINGMWTQFVPYLRNLENFTTHGSLIGESISPRICGYWGRLPDEYHASVAKADYIVSSYATPIAWHNEDGWHMPDVKYSVTTSKQQGRIRTALSVLSDMSY